MILVTSGSTVAAARDLRARIDSFAAFIRSLPADALRPSAWGPREVLSHLVFWHEDYVRIVSAKLAGREADLPVASLSELNARAVTSLRAVDVVELTHRLLRAQDSLDRLAAQPAAHRLRIRIKKGLTSRPLGLFLRVVASHVAGHEARLRRELRLRPSARSRR